MGHHWSHWVNCVRYSVVQRSNSMRYGVVGDDGHWMGNMWGSMNCVVRDHRGGMDSMVGNGVGESWGSVGNYWSGVGNGMGNWVSHMGSQGSNSSMSDRDWPVGSDGRLDLREALGVVSLSDRGMGGAEGLGLDKGPLLAVGRGD